MLSFDVNSIHVDIAHDFLLSRMYIVVDTHKAKIEGHVCSPSVLFELFSHVVCSSGKLYYPLSTINERGNHDNGCSRLLCGHMNCG